MQSHFSPEPHEPCSSIPSGTTPQTFGSKSVTLGSDQAEPLVFQGSFATARCYFASELYFPSRNGRRNTALPREPFTNRSASETSRSCALSPINFSCSTNPLLPMAIDSEQGSLCVVPPLNATSSHSRCAF